MKKSVSSPAISGGGSGAGSVLRGSSPVHMRKSVSTNAFPAPIDIAGAALDAVQREMQVEAIMHVTGMQAGSCLITTGKFPFEVLGSDGRIRPEEKALLDCLIEPCDHEQPPPNPVARLAQNLSYLDLCERDSNISQRYMNFLRRVRRGSSAGKK